MRRKTLIITALCLALALFSCSKSKEKKESEAAQAGKTVDLGETAGQDAQELGADGVVVVGDGLDMKIPTERGKKPKRNPRPSEGLDDAQMAERNAAESLNEDGTPKRGEPAEAQNAAADNAQPGAESDKFDFVGQDDAGKAPEVQPRTRVRRAQDMGIEALINIREFREQTGYAGLLTDAELLGQAVDTRYSAMRLATDDVKQLGFSIQVWRPGNETAAAKRFDDLYAQSFGGAKSKDISSDAYASSHHQINELAFLDRGKRACVLLSCSESICTVEQLRLMAQLITRRL